jgi:hypothetical protein
VSLCLATPVLALALAADSFTLRWTHSVEKTVWQERWEVESGALRLQEGRVQGSGAGMDPPEGSVLQDGWWVYRRDLEVRRLRLAVSGATGSGWQLCTASGCHDLEIWLARDGRAPDRIEISPGADCAPLAVSP